MKAPMIALAALAFASCAGAYEPDPLREEIQAHFNSSAEPTTKDSAWTQRGIFKVGVIDIALLVRKNEWKKLGEAACK